MIKKAISIFIVSIAICSYAYASPDNVEGYNIPVNIRINGEQLKTPAQSFIENGTVYVPIRALCESLGALVAWDNDTETAYVIKESVYLKLSDDSRISDAPAVMYNDSMYVPVRFIAEAFGYGVEWDGRFYNVLITADNYEIAADYIDAGAYSDDDILLLAKLIYAETGNGTFNEMLGIGGVVMNRIRSVHYPSTISGVIYDTNWSVQFPPAFEEDFHCQPSGMAVIAAKCVMHGVNIVGGSTGFGIADDTDSWISQNMDLVCTYGNISFYE